MQPPDRVFITGTDTEIGKTYISACLAAGCPGMRAVKPLASGVNGPGDAEFIAQATDFEPLSFATWRTPVAPRRAAALEDAPLDVPGLCNWLDALPSPVLIEGVGGWRVPLAPDFMVPDLARAARARVIVVAPDRLGVLNHTLLTVEGIERDGLDVLGIVLNQGAPRDPKDSSYLYNEEDLRNLLSIPVAVCPPLTNPSRACLTATGQLLWAQLMLQCA